MHPSFVHVQNTYIHLLNIHAMSSHLIIYHWKQILQDRTEGFSVSFQWLWRGVSVVSLGHGHRLSLHQWKRRTLKESGNGEKNWNKTLNSTECTLIDSRTTREGIWQRRNSTNEGFGGHSAWLRTLMNGWQVKINRVESYTCEPRTFNNIKHLERLSQWAEWDVCIFQCLWRSRSIMKTCTGQEQLHRQIHWSWTEWGKVWCVSRGRIRFGHQLMHQRFHKNRGWLHPCWNQREKPWRVSHGKAIPGCLPLHPWIQ